MKINDIAQWVTILGFGLPLAYFVGTFTTNTSNQFEKIEEKIDGNAATIASKINTISGRFEAIGAVDEKTLNSKIAKNGIVISRIQTDLAAMQQTASEITKIKASLELVMEQVKQLESRGLSPDTLGNSSLEIKKINEKIAALEQQIAAVGSGRANPTGKIEIKSDYQSDFPTRGVGNFDISLIKCSRDGIRATCQFLIKNNTSNDYRTNVYGQSQQTRVILPSGLAIHGSRVILGNQSSKHNITYTFPSQIPTRVDVQFEGIEKDVKGFLLLQFHTNPGTAEFKNVALSS